MSNNKKLDKSKMNYSEYYRKLQEQRVQENALLKANRVKNDVKALYYSRGNEPYLNSLYKMSGDTKNPQQMTRDQIYKKRLDMYLDLSQQRKKFNNAVYQDLQNETYLGALQTSSNNVDNIVLKIAEASPINATQNRLKLIDNLKTIGLTADQAQDLTDQMNEVEEYVLYTFWSEFMTKIVSVLQSNAPTLEILRRFVIKFIEDKVSTMDEESRGSLLASFGSGGSVRSGISSLSSISSRNSGSGSSVWSVGSSISLLPSSSEEDSSDSGNIGQVVPFNRGAVAPYYDDSTSSAETLFTPPARKNIGRPSSASDNSMYRSMYPTTSSSEGEESMQVAPYAGDKSALVDELFKGYNSMNEQISDTIESVKKGSKNVAVDADKQMYQRALKLVQRKYAGTDVKELRLIVGSKNLVAEDYAMLRKLDKEFNQSSTNYSRFQIKNLLKLLAFDQYKEFLKNGEVSSSDSDAQPKTSSKGSSGNAKKSQQPFVDPLSINSTDSEAQPKTPSKKVVINTALNTTSSAPASGFLTSDSDSKYRTPMSQTPNKPNKVVRVVSDELPTTSGKGLRKRYIVGRGVTLKHDVDLNKLQTNTLCVRYKNNSHGYKVKPIKISDECKKVILQLAMNEQLHEDLFYLLVPKEKRLVEHYVQQMRIPIHMSKDNLNDLSERFEVLKGQIQSGNNNPKIKTMLTEITNELYYFGYINKKLYDSIIEKYGK